MRGSSVGRPAGTDLVRLLLVESFGKCELTFLYPGCQDALLGACFVQLTTGASYHGLAED